MKVTTRLGCARFLVIGAALGALGAAGCSRAHLSANYGRSFHDSFAVQTVNPDRQTEPKAVHGLDSQEAAIISSSYRKALAPKEEAAANQGPMLMYAPRGGGGGQNLPPPSVPTDR
jgi:hypothetical protein